MSPGTHVFEETRILLISHLGFICQNTILHRFPLSHRTQYALGDPS